MNFQQLKYAVEVEKTKSITQAAKNLFMGQPNLSKAIKELEKEMGIRIFRRTAKGVEPTRNGLDFLHYAKTILSQLDELQTLYQPESDECFKMKVSVPRATYVAVAFSEFMNQYHDEKNIDIIYKEESPMSTIQDVISGENSIGLIRYQMAHESYFMNLIRENGLSYDVVYQFKMVLLMKETHPLAQLSEIPYRLLGDYVEIVHGDYQIPSLSMEHIKKDENVKPCIKKIYVYDRGSQFDFLERVEGSYMWVSPLPFEVLASHGLVMKPCLAAGENKDVLIYQDKKLLSSKDLRFIEKLKEVAKNSFMNLY